MVVKLSFTQRLHTITRWLLILNLFFLQSYLIRFSIGSYHSNVQELMIAGLLVVFLVWQLSKRQLGTTLKHVLEYRYFLAFIGLSLLSVIFIHLVPISIGDPTNLLREFKFLFFALILAFVFLEVFERRQDRLQGVFVLGWGAVAFGIFSVLFNLLGYNVKHDFRLNGPLDSAVWLAFYSAPFFLFFLIDWFENRKKLTSLLAWIVLALILVGTGSAAAFGALFIVFAVYLFQRHRYLLQKKITKIFLICLSFIFVVFVVQTKIIPSFESKWSSLNDRGEVWKVSTALLTEPNVPLFGLGMGQFQYHYQTEAEKILGQPPQGLYPLQPHNIFLQFWFEFGILGPLFVVFCFWKIFTKLYWSKNPMHADELIFILILLYFFLHGLIDIPFFKNDLMFLLLVFLELALGKPRVSQLQID